MQTTVFQQEARARNLVLSLFQVQSKFLKREFTGATAINTV